MELLIEIMKQARGYELPIMIALAVVMAGYRGWWVYGPSADRMIRALERDRDDWKHLALSLSGVAEVAVRNLEERGR